MVHILLWCKVSYYSTRNVHIEIRISVFNNINKFLLIGMLKKWGNKYKFVIVVALESKISVSFFKTCPFVNKYVNFFKVF